MSPTNPKNNSDEYLRMFRQMVRIRCFEAGQSAVPLRQNAGPDPYVFGRGGRGCWDL